MKVKNDHRSKFSNLSNWKEEAWKKSGLQRDSNPWPPRYRCVALPTVLWSHTLGARSIYWVHISCEEWNPVEALIFFRLLSNCLNWKIYCDDHSSLSSSTAVQKWIMSYILRVLPIVAKRPWCRTKWSEWDEACRCFILYILICISLTNRQGWYLQFRWNVNSYLFKIP